MTANTPTYGWPYPTGPDRLDTTLTETIRNGLLAIESTLTGWGGIAAPGAWHSVGAAGEPAFGANWSNYGGTFDTVQYRKVGSQLFIRGLALRSSSTSGADSTIFTLPAGFRPLKDTFFPAEIGAAGRVQVKSGGPVTIFNAIAAGSYVALWLPPIWLD